MGRYISVGRAADNTTQTAPIEAEAAEDEATKQIKPVEFTVAERKIAIDGEFDGIGTKA